jgi:hypothetical protein
MPLPPIHELESDKQEEPIHWHVFALIFVALPAIAGLFFENGSAVMTDVLLLGLGCLFLYWSVKWPWQWYTSCQTRVFIDYQAESAIEEDSDHESEHSETTEKGESPEAKLKTRQTKAPTLPTRQAQASRSLQNYELVALFSCFFSPMAIAFLLHNIRPYLSRPSGGVVSNSNLTLFVLAAEVRPVLHLFRLLEYRTLHLQRVVQTAEPTSIDDAQDKKIDNLLRRISEIETTSKETSRDPEEDVRSPEDKKEIVEAVKMILQPQVDALNRAVRRYEKRERLQSGILESRLRDLDTRVNDALSLAASAARHSRPGLLGWVGESVYAVTGAIVATVATIFLAPLRGFESIWFWLVGGRPRKKKEEPVKVKRVSSVSLGKSSVR